LDKSSGSLRRDFTTVTCDSSDRTVFLGEQIRKAALSVSTNIAEGTGREGERESKHFFNIAKGSVYEVVSLLHVMRERNYLTEEKYRIVYLHCDEIARMLSGLINK
jgi:four helix bundle protein